jgi:predicted oxidoreductase
MDYLWNDCEKDANRIMSQNHGDQDWITKRAKENINYWPDEWIRSYKWEMIGLKDTKLVNKDGKHFFRTPAKVEPGNRVAVFHGQPNPMECADKFVEDNWR